LGAGSVDAALNNYVALHYRAKHMSWLHCFWGVGASIGPVIMSFFLINKNSWNLGYRAIGLLQCCLVTVLFTTIPLWGKNRSQNGNWANETHQGIKFKELFHTAGVKQVLVAFFCYCSLESTVGLWGSSFLVMEKKVLPEIAARWISLYYFGITAGRFISGFLTMKFNNRQMVRLGQAFAACGIIALIIPVGRVLLLPGFFIIGLGCAPIYPSLLHETPVNFGSGKSQAIMGIQMASAYIGTTFMPPLFGKITSFLSFSFFPLFTGAILIVNIIMVELLNKNVDRNKA
jgi:fucose permease